MKKYVVNPRNSKDQGWTHEFNCQHDAEISVDEISNHINPCFADDLKFHGCVTVIEDGEVIDKILEF